VRFVIGRSGYKERFCKAKRERESRHKQQVREKDSERSFGRRGMEEKEFRKRKSPKGERVQQKGPKKGVFGKKGEEKGQRKKDCSVF
jgi:hypothetical protein